VGVCKDFRFGTQVNHSESQPVDDKGKERGLSRYPFYILDPIHISGMAEARAVKCCIQNQVLPKGWLITPKGTWLGSRDTFLHGHVGHDRHVVEAMKQWHTRMHAWVEAEKGHFAVWTWPMLNADSNACCWCHEINLTLLGPTIKSN